MIADRATLVIIHGEPFAKVFEIADEPIHIGRSFKCDIRFDDDSVSRNHCRVWREGKTYHIRDLGSTNRTRVNGQPIDEIVLADGDRVSVGETVLKFVLGGSVEADYHAALYEQATRDPLTNLPNRRLFGDVLTQEIEAARRHARKLSLAVIDVDHFKEINDNFDHVFGDAVLQCISNVLRDELREGETVARMGGEEFCLVQPGADLDNARQRAEELRGRIEAAEIECNDQTLSITVSIGVAEYSGAEDATALFRVADEALIRAKKDGRNRVYCADTGAPAG